MKDTALLIIDMQDFFLKNFVPEVKKELISNQQKVIALCSKRKIPIIAIEYKCRGIFRGRTTLVLRKYLKVATTHTVIKESNSAFTKTELDKILKDLKIKKVLIMGVNANSCVQDTAMGALKRGYKVITAEDLMASSSSHSGQLSRRNKEWFETNTIFYHKSNELLVKLAK